MSLCCGGDDDKTHLNTRSKSRPKSCTDCICFIIFIIFVLGLAAITIVTSLDSGLDRIFYGFDSYGNVCNRNNKAQKSQTNYNGHDTTNLKYVLYFDITKPLESKKVCVKECPTQNIATREEYEKYSNDKQASLCFYNVSIGVYDEKLCPKLPIVNSKKLAHRCVPNPEDLLRLGIQKIEGVVKLMRMTSNTTFADYFNAEMIKLWVIRVYDDLYRILMLSGIALLVAIILVFLLRYIAKVMVALVLISISLGFIGLTTWLWVNYAEIRRTSSGKIENIYGIEVESEKAFLIYSIVATVVTVILLLIVFVMRKRICLVIRLFEETQKALSSMPLLFVLPLATFAVLIMFIFYWLSTSMLIYSFGTYDTDSFDSFNISFSKKHIQTAMWVYHFIALVWITEFIFGCQALIVASSVAKWYFTRDKKSLNSPICLSIRNLVVYHMGSVAFGSFLITLVRVPRYILMRIEETVKKSNSKTAEFCAKSCICCLWCLEKFIKYVNFNAYTIIAIEGKSFCASAKKAFIIIMENALRIATINSVGDFMLFLSKVFVTGITAAIAIPILNIYSIEEAKSQILSIILVCLIAFLIAHCFFTVYEMVIDAMMVCFCEDCKANDGSVERPYYMSNSLKEFIDESSTHITIND